MGRNAKDVLNEALQLPAMERAELAAALLDSLEGAADDSIATTGGLDLAWGEEISRRVAEVDRGLVERISWEDAQRVIDRDDPDA